MFEVSTQWEFQTGLSLGILVRNEALFLCYHLPSVGPVVSGGSLCPKSILFWPLGRRGWFSVPYNQIWRAMYQHSSLPLLVPPFPTGFPQEVETMSGYPGVLGTSYPDGPRGPIKICHALGLIAVLRMLIDLDRNQLAFQYECLLSKGLAIP